MDTLSQLFTVVLEKRAAEQPAADWRQSLKKILDDPLVGYGAVGAAAGGGLSLIKSLTGSPEDRQGMLGRALGTAAIGGLTGSGLAAGMRMMGRRPPSVSELPQVVQGKPEKRKSDPVVSLGVGAGGGVGAGILSAAERMRIRRQELLSALGSEKAMTEAAGLSPVEWSKGTKKSPSVPLQDKTLHDRQLRYLVQHAAEKGQQHGPKAAIESLKRKIRRLSQPGAELSIGGVFNRPEKIDTGVVSRLQQILDTAGDAQAAKRIDRSLLARLGKTPAALAGVALTLGGGHYLVDRLREQAASRAQE